MFCGDDEDNYSGPLFPSDVEAILAGAGALYDAGHPEFEWSSDEARQRWRSAVEAAAERIAAPRIAKRKACPGEVPEVSLSVSAGDKAWPVTVEVSPGPASVRLTWQVRLGLLEGPLMSGVSAETKAQVAQVRAGFTARGLQAVTIDVPPSGTASETFVVTRSPLFVSDVGGQYATVWINGETQCGSIASTGSFPLPPV